MDFHVLSLAETLRLCAFEVTTSVVTRDGIPVAGGLRDPRFGATRQMACGMCGRDEEGCRGHFAFYSLKKPLYGLHAPHLANWLRAICPECGHLQWFNDKQLWRETRDLADLARSCGKKCSECQTELKSWQWCRKTQCVRCGEETLDAQQALTHALALDEEHDIFKSTTLPHPANCIERVVRIPPVTLRPPIGGRAGQDLRGESDLTYRISAILKGDEDLRKALNSGDETAIRTSYRGLQETYTKYVDGGAGIDSDALSAKKGRRKPSNSKRKGPKYANLKEKVVGKGGFFRGNLLGKRVNFSGRFVASPGPFLHPKEVGISPRIARELTVPETVTDWNVESLEQMLRDGKVTYVENLQGERTHVRQMSRHSMRLYAGWKVHRHLRSGDVGVLNRQPTLHRGSLMCVVIRVLEEESDVIRIPLATTPAFNADFDGDEMNLHIPQGYEARAECWALMRVALCVLSTKTGTPTVHCVQDTIAALYDLTKPGTTISRHEWFHCVSAFPDRLLKRAASSRPSHFPTDFKRLVSLILPEEFSCDTKVIRVFRGDFRRGRLNKKTLGGGSLSLVHGIAQDLGGDAALDFIDAAQRLAHAWHALDPATWSVADITRTQSLAERCKAIVAEYRSKATGMKLGSDDARSLMVQCRVKMLEVLESSEDYDGSGLANIISSGAKGKQINLQQLLTALGAQSSTFPQAALSGRRLFSSHEQAHPFDVFVGSSYAQGLTPEEYTLHAKSGREGLIDSAVKTSKVGYITRRLVKFMESLVVQANGTVVDEGTGTVVQWMYGSDGRDPQTMELEFFNPPKARKPFAVWEAEAEETLRTDVQFVSELRGGDARSAPFDMPISLSRLFAAEEPCAFDPPDYEFLWDEVVELSCFECPLVAAWLRIHLHPNRFRELEISKAGARRVLDKVKRRLEMCRVQPGESVGCVAAQSEGEATMQLTLDSLHSIGAECVSESLPAFEQIADANKKRSTTWTRFRLEKGVDLDQWLHKHKMITLSDIMLERGTSSVAKNEALLQERYYLFPDIYSEDKKSVQVNVVTWFLVRHRSAIEVRNALLRHGGSRARVAYARTNEGNLLLHCNFVVDVENVVIRGDCPRCVVVSSKRRNSRQQLQTTLSADEILHMEGVDPTTIFSNDIWRTLRTLGAEAARGSVQNQLSSILDSYGVAIQQRHLMLFSDCMLNEGTLCGCTRFGLKEKDLLSSRGIDVDVQGILHRAGYECSFTMLSEAAMQGLHDPLTRNHSLIALGLPINAGTSHHSFDVFKDETMIPPPQEHMYKTRAQAQGSSVFALPFSFGAPQQPPPMPANVWIPEPVWCPERG